MCHCVSVVHSKSYHPFIMLNYAAQLQQHAVHYTHVLYALTVITCDDDTHHYYEYYATTALKQFKLILSHDNNRMISMDENGWCINLWYFILHVLLLLKWWSPKWNVPSSLVLELGFSNQQEPQLAHAPRPLFNTLRVRIPVVLIEQSSS